MNEMRQDTGHSSGRRLMVAYAHPDDEVFTAGGTIALAAQQGTEVVLVLATGGEEGEVVNPAVRDRVSLRDLPRVRQEELACAQRTLGISRIERLGYRDSGMADTPSSREPEAFCNQDREEVAERLVRAIRAARPHVIVTEPEDGGYGHPDHIALHLAMVLAFERAGDPAWYPSAGEPWAPSKLYFSTWSRRSFLQLRDAYAAHGLEFRFGTGIVIIDEADMPGRPAEEITTEVDVRDTIDTKIRAMRCYETQILPDFFYFTAPPDVARDVLGREFFMLGASRVPYELPERHLFAGVTP